MRALLLILAASLPTVAISQERAPFQAEGAVAQMPGFCFEPQDPLLDEGSLEILGMTRGEEFTRYMNEAQAYSYCLERTRDMFYEKLRGLLAEYESSGTN